jgi:hypothetical protein
MENRAYYAVVPANVRYDDRLTMLSRMIYAEITALCNKEGYCWASNSYFAELYNMSIRSISRAINELRECGYITIEINYKKNSREVENRIIRISTPPIDKIDVGYRQNCPAPLDKNVQENNTFNNTINNIYADKFTEFWNKYPRRLQKANALEKYKKIIEKGIATPEQILSGLDKYINFLKANKTEDKYIKYPVTWLNQKCWEDDWKSEENLKNKYSDFFRLGRRK